MNSDKIFIIVADWVASILNPPGTAEINKVPIIQSEEDLVLPTNGEACIIIDYSPTPIDSQGAVIGKLYKNDTNGIFTTSDIFENIDNFFNVSDGSISVSMDGAVAVEVTDIDLSGSITLTEVAITLGAILKKIEGLENILVNYDSPNNVFCFESSTVGETSSCVLSAGTEGTDLLGENYFNGGVSVEGTTNDSYSRNLYTQYESEFEIRQVYGTGDLLQLLLNSLWKQKTIQYYSKNNLGISRTNAITTVPATLEDRTIRESLTSLVLSHYGIIVEEMPVFNQTGLQGEIASVDGDSSSDIDLEIGGTYG